MTPQIHLSFHHHSHRDNVTAPTGRPNLRSRLHFSHSRGWEGGRPRSLRGHWWHWERKKIQGSNPFPRRHCPYPIFCSERNITPQCLIRIRNDNLVRNLSAFNVVRFCFALYVFSARTAVCAVVAVRAWASWSF